LSAIGLSADGALLQGHTNEGTNKPPPQHAPPGLPPRADPDASDVLMRSVGLRRRLIVLAVAGLLPLAAMSGFGLYTVVQQQREQVERSSLDLARALGSAVDGELRSAMAVLEGLATAPSLDSGDADGFYRTAQRVAQTQPQWRAVILHEPNGRVVVHTGYPLGRPDLAIAEPGSFDQVMQTRTPLVGPLRRGQRGEFGVPVRVPVLRDGQLRFVLTGVVNPEAILDVIARQHTPNDWVVSVFDSKGARVARSRAHGKYLGSPAAPSLQRLMAAAGDEGVGMTYALEGDPVLTAYAKTKASGWVVAIGIPADSVDASAYRSAAVYGGGLLLSLLVGAGIALALARSINRPIGELRRAAQALGRGDLPAIGNSEIRELQEVADALVSSAEQRARDEAERERLLLAERAARGGAEQARRRLELLSSAGAVLSRSLQPHATLEAIASIVVPNIADWCRVDLVDAEGHLQRALTHHSDPQKSRFGAELVQRLHASAETPGSMAWTVATGRSHLAHFDPPTEFDRIRDRDLLSFARAIGLRAYFIVPLVARGRTLGAMAALQAESERGFSEDDCALLSEIAQRAALALDNARLYADAQAARSQAETANRVKDEFLAMLGHELRNPLAPIVTALHLMARRAGDESAMERRIIERQVAHLLRLVDDLLDVSRIARGKIQIEREPVDLKAVVERALELTQPALERRALQVEVSLPPAPVVVSGDAVRLAQVLSNLLTNAAKFTPGDAPIRVRLRTQRSEAAGADDGADEAEVVVEDEGSGIAPELLPKVFDLFTQGEQGMDRHAGGLGLGLAIVKTLVQLHGGSVQAESGGLGRGARFTVRLPLASSAMLAAPRSDAPSATSARHGRVLLVDDNADAAETAAALLQASGHEVRTAIDGPSALQLLDDFTPQIALLDIGLPGMDGYELASRLRADPRLAGMHLVALTGYGRDLDRARALATYFDEHLVKPVSAERLLDTVATLLDTATT
jgi:signal transduction histidine kinase/ActR/RegA family two-component response regulator/HAMP domain-containing protein